MFNRKERTIFMFVKACGDDYGYAVFFFLLIAGVIRIEFCLVGRKRNLMCFPGDVLLVAAWIQTNDTNSESKYWC